MLPQTYPLITEDTVFIGTIQDRVHAVDPSNGTEVWQRDLRTHLFAVVTGTPAFHNNKLYVPVSSIEVVQPNKVINKLNTNSTAKLEP